MDPVTATTMAASAGTTLYQGGQQVSQLAKAVTAVDDIRQQLLGNDVPEITKITSHNTSETRLTPIIAHMITLLQSPDHHAIKSESGLIIESHQPSPSLMAQICGCSASTFIQMQIPEPINETLVKICSDLRGTTEAEAISALSRVEDSNTSGKKTESSFIATLFLCLIALKFENQNTRAYDLLGKAMVDQLFNEKSSCHCLPTLCQDAKITRTARTLHQCKDPLLSLFSSIPISTRKIDLNKSYRDLIALLNALSEKIFRLCVQQLSLTCDATGTSISPAERRKKYKSLKQPGLTTLCLSSQFGSLFEKTYNVNSDCFDSHPKFLSVSRLLLFFHKHLTTHHQHIMKNSPAGNNADMFYCNIGIQIAFYFISLITQKPLYQSIYSKMVMIAYIRLLSNIHTTFIDHDNEIIITLENSKNIAREILRNNKNDIPRKDTWLLTFKKIFFEAIHNPEEIILGLRELIENRTQQPRLGQSPLVPQIGVAEVLHAAMVCGFSDWRTELSHPQGDTASEFFNTLCTSLEPHRSLDKYDDNNKPLDNLILLIKQYQSGVILTSEDYKKFRQDLFMTTHNLLDQLRARFKQDRYKIFYGHWQSVSPYLLYYLLLYGIAKKTKQDPDSSLTPEKPSYHLFHQTSYTLTNPYTEIPPGIINDGEGVFSRPS